MGDCGWTRCPRNSDLSHIGQDTARSWFRVCLTQKAHSKAIFAHVWFLSRTYRGARGQERAVGHRAMEAHVKCSKRLPSFGRFDQVFRGRFGPKKGVLGHKMRTFGGAPPDLAPPPQAATGDFLAQSLDLERPPPRV